MNGWWHWWLTSHSHKRQTETPKEYPARCPDEMPPEQAAALMVQPAARHPVNFHLLATAARRLQRQLGNRGVQLLAKQRGEPVPSGLRTEMSAELGDDLADVRLHTGPTGAAVARAAGVEAVTMGREIAFDSGAYGPDTPAGRRLLAHELRHTVQAGQGSGRDPGVLEQQARSQSQPARGAAPSGQVLFEEARSWQERVCAARTETDLSARRTALIALVQEALAGYTVNVAPASPSRGPVHPDQYRPAPAINFDFYLEQKEYWPGAGRRGVLGPRTGYFFSTGGRAYAIIGPRAVEGSSPILTRMHADHELFHTQHHTASWISRNDQELEAWTDAFVNYFHQVHHLRRTWRPLIDYYEGASTGARARSLQAIVDYYNRQPAEIQRAMLAWLRRRQRDMADRLLVRHLTTRLTPVPPSRPGAAPPSPPPP